jgi:hypothetical protein
MKLIYNYQNGDFAVSHDTSVDAVKKELNGADEMVYIFDISHWDTDDFTHFTSLHEDEQVGYMEYLTFISGATQ